MEAQACRKTTKGPQADPTDPQGSDREQNQRCGSLPTRTGGSSGVRVQGSAGSEPCLIPQPGKQTPQGRTPRPFPHCPQGQREGSCLSPQPPGGEPGTGRTLVFVIHFPLSFLGFCFYIFLSSNRTGRQS